MFAAGGGGPKNQGYDPHQLYTINISAWNELFKEEIEVINALHELVEIIAVLKWKLTTREYLNVNWLANAWLDKDHRPIHNNRKNHINNLLDHSRISRQHFGNAREDCCHPYDRLQHLLALRPQMPPDCPNMKALQECIRLRAGTIDEQVPAPQLTTLGITPPTPPFVQLGVQTSNIGLHPAPPMTVKPRVDLEDHDPGYVPLDTDNFDEMLSSDELYSLADLDQMLHSFCFTDDARRKIEAAIVLNRGFPNDAIPQANDTLIDLLQDRSYTLTGERTSPATLRAARLTNAEERDDVTQVIVSPADMLTLGATLAKESVRNGYAPGESINARLLLEARSFAQIRGPDKHDALDKARGCIALNLALVVERRNFEEAQVSPETINNFARLEFACGGGDRLNTEQFVEVMAIMARNREYDNRRELCYLVARSTLFHMRLSATVYRILSGDVGRDVVQENSVEHPLLSQIPGYTAPVKQFVYGGGGGFPGAAFSHGLSSVDDVPGEDEYDETLPPMSIVLPNPPTAEPAPPLPATANAVSEEDDEDVWGAPGVLYNCKHDEDRAPAEAFMLVESGYVAQDGAGNAVHRYFPVQMWWGGGYICFKIPGGPWAICLLRMVSCLFCSIYIITPQVSNLEFDEETGASLSTHTHAGLAFTRHLVPMMRGQMKAIRAKIKKNLVFQQLLGRVPIQV